MHKWIHASSQQWLWNRNINIWFLLHRWYLAYFLKWPCPHRFLNNLLLFLYLFRNLLFVCRLLKWQTILTSVSRIRFFSNQLSIIVFHINQLQYMKRLSHVIYAAWMSKASIWIAKSYMYVVFVDVGCKDTTSSSRIDLLNQLSYINYWVCDKKIVVDVQTKNK